MNIFYLSKDHEECARMHLDKHVVKMILEYAQLLSTAHRVLDGQQIIEERNNRKVKIWKLEDQLLDSSLYKATHINHPSAIWVRQSVNNYNWLIDLLCAVCKEYTFRYEKIHKVERSGLLNTLTINIPRNISDKEFIEPPPAMPDKYKVYGNSIASYRNYYIGAKNGFAKWKNRSKPIWFNQLTTI